MNDLRTPVVQLACALGLALIAQGCREDLGCPPGTVLVGDACEDAPDLGMPDATTPDAGLDPDGSTADGCTAMLFYVDADEDGLGAGEGVSACEAPEGYVANADDCDDSCEVCGDREEVCDGEDNDCDGDTDEGIMVVCGTNEGECSTGIQLCVGGVLGACEGGVMPAVAEVCEGSRDENCDGEVDEDCDCVVGMTRPCGVDTGECARGLQTCTEAGVFGECLGAVGPVDEVCNGKDDDCDGVDDNGNPGGGASCGSNVGECRAGTEMCTGGHVTCVGSIGPVPEVCNGKDDDCSNGIDEGVTTTFYRDADGDTRGTPNITVQACAAPSGYVANANDCNDMCGACWTGATEVCDGLDNNCTAGVDEGVTTRYYRDADSDTYGDPAMFVDACSAPPSHVLNSGDCNDMCSVCWTGATEVCDGFDNNCMGGTDEGFTCTVGQSVACTTTCGTTGTGTCTGMCAIPTGISCTPPAETCNSTDDDCDGLTDEGLRGFGAAPGGPLGNAAKLARAGAGYVGILRYNGFARLYATSATGTVTQNAVNVEESDVSAVDIARISDTQWVTAAAFGNGGVNVRLIGLSGGVPVSQDVELAYNTSSNSLARVAARSNSDAMTVFQAGSSIRVAHVDFAGAVATSVALPGSSPRAELGMDIAATANGYVVTWVTGMTPTVNIALVSAPDMVVTYNAPLGAGSNPSVSTNSVGGVGVAYTGPDGRPRFHRLTPTLTCTGGAARDTCAEVTSQRTIATPTGAGTFHSTLDLQADGVAWWLVARTSDGELVQRVSTHVHDDIFRTASTTAWMTVAATGESPLILRGAGTGFTHNVLACAP